MASMTPEEFTKFISVENTSGKLPGLLCRYGKDANCFLTEYCIKAQKNGAIIAGGLVNPTPEQLKYYTEISTEKRSYHRRRLGKPDTGAAEILYGNSRAGLSYGCRILPVCNGQIAAGMQSK